ncbi:gamma-glutamyltranspeptidase [Falsiroseomonas bella]|uniref:Gamma-glutamyltranspeptidase n=1 Tax=Falsiroseomonas bella TaxID=2184016 RepID=A0A317FMF5_9PROT|nr:gamma-glutamyltransferase [Falsiroseomonas bella]PWS39237.1 gamma-glutamyltranspeptidase [Falsiroseomonas bella]
MTSKPRLSRMAGLLALMALPGCSTLDSMGAMLGGPPPLQPGQEGFVRGFLGHVVADEPRAATVARTVLSTGGSAADAAVAAGLTMAVTLPSRAGLGGGGACLLFNPARNAVEAVVFPPGARSGVPAGADRPAAVPMLARGLFALHTRGGRRPFEELMAPAEQAARFGFEVSRALATDFAAVSGPLFADPWAAASFGGADGRPPQVGERLVQADLGVTLATLRTAGVGDLYQGGLARRVEEASVPAGGGLTSADLRASVPRIVQARQQRIGSDIASFLPAEISGGAETEAAFQALMAGGAPPPAGPSLMPASATLLTLDRDGMAVACAFTMNNLFGTGRVAPGTGILLGAAPDVGQVRPPLLATGLVHNPNVRAFRAAAAGSGQGMAALAAAQALAGMVRGQPAPQAVAGIPEPGRAAAIGCTRYLPGPAQDCTAATDPRGSGLALGGLDR